MFSLTRTQCYAFTVLGVIVFGLLRWILDPLLGSDLPLILFIIPIVLASWAGGLWPGLLATILSILLGDYLFLAPRGTLFRHESHLDLERTIELGLAGMALSILFDTIRKGIKRQMEWAERFLLMAENVRDYEIFTCDTDGCITSWNPGAARIEGYEETEVIGRDFSAFYTPEDIQSGKPHSQLDIAAAAGSCEEECWQIRKDGSRFWASGIITALRDDRGELRGFVKVTRDMTERRRVEEEREHFLAQEKAAREAAEAANRTKDEFLAMISHELRTPLTAILGWSRMLAGGLLSEAQTHRAIVVINRSANAQAQLIDDILDASSIMTGKLKLEARPVEIELVLEAAVDIIQPTVEAKRIALNLRADKPISLVLGDPNRLQQAIWNLLSNAVRFTDEGGSIQILLTEDARGIVLCVHDTGIGIEAQFLLDVFEPFRQEDATSTRRFGGLGLGLTISRYVVEMHGGSISASSPGKGQGSTFTIRLPRFSGTLAGDRGPLHDGRLKGDQ